MTRHSRQLTRAAGAAAIGFAALLAAGCAGDPGTGTVTGVVKVGGKPLKAGLITFDSQVGKRDASSARIKDGVYTTGPIAVGPTKVSVVPTLDSGTGDGPPPESQFGDLRPAPKKASDEPKVNSKYQNSDTSGLTFDVAKGENKKDFDLDP